MQFTGPYFVRVIGFRPFSDDMNSYPTNIHNLVVYHKPTSGRLATIISARFSIHGSAGHFQSNRLNPVEILTCTRTSLSKKLTNADKDDFFKNIKCTIDGGYSNYGITPSL